MVQDFHSIHSLFEPQKNLHFLTPLPMENSSQKVYGNFSDHALLDLSDIYSLQILEGLRKFMGLLPEIHLRRLFEKRGCSSIFEFGAKRGALSEEQVRRALNLDERCEKENLPLLRKAFTKGEVSINKLTRVMSIATPENEAELLPKLKVLPQSAVEVMVRDFKIENGLNKPKNDQESVRAHTNLPEFSGKSTHEAKGQNFNDLNLSPEILQKLIVLQTKGIDLNKLLAQFLDERDRRIEEEKQEIVKEDELAANGGRTNEEWDEIDREMGVITLYFPPPRYVRARTKNVLKEEFGTKCVIPHCPKPSKPLHHTDRFSLSGENNPYYLAPLCKDHHTLAHSVDLKSQQKRREALGAP